LARSERRSLWGERGETEILRQSGAAQSLFPLKSEYKRPSLPSVERGRRSGALPFRIERSVWAASRSAQSDTTPPPAARRLRPGPEVRCRGRSCLTAAEEVYARSWRESRLPRCPGSHRRARPFGRTLRRMRLRGTVPRPGDAIGSGSSSAPRTLGYARGSLLPWNRGSCPPCLGRASPGFFLSVRNRRTQVRGPLGASEPLRCRSQATNQISSQTTASRPAATTISGEASRQVRRGGGRGCGVGSLIGSSRLTSNATTHAT
jgi:hypothetical protein